MNEKTKTMGGIPMLCPETLDIDGQSFFYTHSNVCLLMYPRLCEVTHSSWWLNTSYWFIAQLTHVPCANLRVYFDADLPISLMDEVSPINGII